jgi:capsular exopolysaccharide synthesis family protein
VNADQYPMENPFAEHGRTLRRRKWWIVGTAVVVTLAALGYSFTETKQYTATAQVQVLPITVSTSANGGPASSPQTLTQEAQTDAALIVTPKVKAAVVAYLGEPAGTAAPPVAATVSPTSNLLLVSASAPTAKQAADYAVDYVNQFQILQKAQAVTNYKAQANAILEQIANDTTAEAPLKAALAHVATNKNGGLEYTPAQQADENTLEGLQKEVTALGTSLSNLTTSSQLATGGVLLVANPVLPKSPSSPKTARNVGLGFAVGLILGIVLAFVIDGLDDSVRSEDDVDRAYPNLPHLGIIPMVDGWNDASRPYVVTMDAPLSVAAEAYRSLRTAVEFARLNRSVRTILITSSMGLEGKTSTAANMGVAFAGSGQRTLMVSADLRRPRLGTFFALSEEVGLTSVALGIATPEEAIQTVEDVPGLYFLGTGPLPAGAAEFLSSPKLEEVIGDLRDRFDILIIDAPPVLPVTDAVVMSRYLDGVLVVVAQNRTHRRSLARVHALLTQVGSQVLGSMINGAAIKGADAYGYYGQYGGYYGTYGAKGAESDRKRSRGDNKRGKSSRRGKRGSESEAERARTGT